MVPVWRVCVPPPHDMLHVDHALASLETTQSTGHLWVLHCWFSLRTEGQAWPPHAGCCVMLRVRIRAPRSPW